MQKIVTCVAYTQPMLYDDGARHCFFDFSVSEAGQEIKTVHRIDMGMSPEVQRVLGIPDKGLVKLLFHYARERVSQMIEQGKLPAADKHVFYTGNPPLNLPELYALPDPDDFTFTVDIASEIDQHRL